MATVIVRDKVTGIRGVIVGYSTSLVPGPDGRPLIQPLVGVTWLEESYQDPAVQTVAQDSIVADEVLEGSDRIDEYHDEESEEAPADTQGEPPVDNAPGSPS